jgi:hypothetical protein
MNPDYHADTRHNRQRGASGIICRTASVVTQRPTGTPMPSIRESLPEVRLSPTTAYLHLIDRGKSST